MAVVLCCVTGVCNGEIQSWCCVQPSAALSQRATSRFSVPAHNHLAVPRPRHANGHSVARPCCRGAVSACWGPNHLAGVEMAKASGGVLPSSLADRIDAIETNQRDTDAQAFQRAVERRARVSFSAAIAGYAAIGLACEMGPGQGRDRGADYCSGPTVVRNAASASCCSCWPPTSSARAASRTPSLLQNSMQRCAVAARQARVLLMLGSAVGPRSFLGKAGCPDPFHMHACHRRTPTATCGL
jgi:hypothetical protein